MSNLLKSISVKFTEDRLIQAVKEFSLCDEVIIQSIEEKSGAEKRGDSYLSSIYRFTVNAQGKTKTKEGPLSLHVIAKGIPKNVGRRKTFRSFNFFETEINFYKNVWPLMKKLKDSKNLNELDEIPLHLSSFSDGTNDYIALKDLSYDGYITIQRDVGTNKECALLFLKVLANFHALSIAAKQQDPEFEEVARSLKETYFDEKFRNWYSGFMEHKLYKAVRKAVETQLEPVYLEHLNKLLSNDFYGLLCRLVKNPNKKLLAVVHGDVWIPNFLVKLNQGDPVHGVLIDFQLSRYSSITYDLVHFLYCCISQELLLTHWDDLVKEYHTNLSKRIDELGGDGNIITLEDIKEDIQNNCHVGFAMAVESTVMSSLEDHEVPDLDSIEGDEAVPLEVAWDISPFEDKQRNKKIAFLIKHAVDKGFI